MQLKIASPGAIFTKDLHDSEEITNKNESLVCFDDAVVVVSKSYRVVVPHLMQNQLLAWQFSPAAS
ncbi:hypothetical protein C8N47_1027 [Mangrovibacterium marinum]|uniref:Uncharacterized protein n=1 Tax=Mangrovibacterium marinum TaxID=1639118 RepID=A0A2T5C540_9BACT|nr:hypothetical protein C8N47_1027 [Mangrovibacterium marinum]